MNSWPKRVDGWFFAILLLSSLLLLIRLGDGRLWQDEAETAVLGKNILRYGYPRAFDGVNRLNPSLPVAKGEAWTYHTWGSFYVTAASFALLGTNTFAARLPFALMGLASIGLAYRLVQRWMQDHLLTRFFAFTLTLCIPFLLHMRQCRYYAPSVLLSLWTVWAYWRFLLREPRSAPELTCALVLLFHFNHGVFLPLLLALGFHFIWTRAYQYQGRRALMILGLILALTLPFAFTFQAWQHHGESSWKEIRHHTEFYFREINHYLLPVTFWLVALLFWRPSLESLFGTVGSPKRRAWELILCILGVGLLFLIFGPKQRHFRYLIHLAPWLLLLQSTLLVCLIRFRAWIGVPVALVLLFTDLHYAGPEKIRCLQVEFLGELTHSYRGPVDGIIEFLLAHAKPHQTLKIPYDDHAVILYTGLAVEPITKPEDFLRETYPDWIVIRHDWIPAEFFTSPYYTQIQSRYRRFVLDAPDIPWQNRPDPGYHRFRTDTTAVPVILFQKK